MNSWKTKSLFSLGRRNCPICGETEDIFTRKRRVKINGRERYINILTCISCKYYCEFPKDMWKYYRYTHAKIKSYGIY